jgi:tetratricopeptide (TPR) repeat protein
LALQERLAADFPTVPQYRLQLAGSHNNLGVLLEAQGKRAEAEAAYRQALALQERLAADFPTVPQYRRSLAASHNNVGNLLRELGKRAEAEAALRQALALHERLAAEFPAVPAYAVELGESYWRFGLLVRDGGQPAESLAWYAKAIATLQPVLAREPRLVTAQELVQHAQLALAAALIQTGQLDRGLSTAEELARSPRAGAGTLYNCACVHAMAAAAVKDADAAERHCARAVALLRESVAKGWKDAAHMKRDTDLDPLRKRDDFQKLLAELEAKK